MHDMHAPSIWKAVGSSAKGPTWLIVGRAPLESPESVPLLNPLDDEAAKHILGDVEDAETILSRLGGHPLALHLHRPGVLLPKEEDIEAFVHHGLGRLERRRTDGGQRIGPHSLRCSGRRPGAIRSGRRPTSERCCCGEYPGGLQLRSGSLRPTRDDGRGGRQERGAGSHRALVNQQSALASMMVAHRMLAGVGGLAEAAGVVMATATGGGLSALLEDALVRAPEDEQDHLLGVAADVAVRRGELMRAGLPRPDGGTGPTALAALLHLEGRTDGAGDLLMDAVQTTDSLRPRLALITARIEDVCRVTRRCRGGAGPAGTRPLPCPWRVRRTAVVAKALLRFSVLVVGGRLDEAPNCSQT